MSESNIEESHESAPEKLKKMMNKIALCYLVL